MRGGELKLLKQSVFCQRTFPLLSCPPPFVLFIPARRDKMSSLRHQGWCVASPTAFASLMAPRSRLTVVFTKHRLECWYFLSRFPLLTHATVTNGSGLNFGPKSVRGEGGGGGGTRQSIHTWIVLPVHVQFLQFQTFWFIRWSLRLRVHLWLQKSKDAHLDESAEQIVFLLSDSPRSIYD